MVIFVSQGPSPTLTVVPNFKNLTEATAKQNAERNDLVPLFEYIPSEDGSVEKGRVISQSIEPNEKVEKNTVVTIYVCNGETPQKSSSIDLSINESAIGEYVFKYYIDGVLQEELTETRDISLSKQINWQISGTGIHSYAIVVENTATGQSKTLIELEVNFDTEPVDKQPKTFNENVFKELQTESSQTTAQGGDSTSAPDPFDFDPDTTTETSAVTLTMPETESGQDIGAL